jgi:multiple sugar transport system ATP-binding protein
MAAVRFTAVSKRFGAVEAVRALTLDIADGEFVVLVGPSGSGKTTALRMLAGLESVSAGEIAIGDRVVNRVAPRERDIAMVFQDYALYPQMSVYDNLAFGLRRRRLPKAEIDERVRAAAQALDIGALLDRKPGQLSGGQAQRVALGRALVREPQVFLMDEPLSNLDAKLRTQTRGEIKRLQAEVGTTTVYVTHDQVEAMTLGERVAVMRDGVLQQVDTPQNLFNKPRNLFVAAFIGSPAMNLVEARIEGGRVHFAGIDLPLPGGSPLAGSERRVILGLRPSDFEHAAGADPDWPRIRVKPDVVEQLGSETLLIFGVDAPPVMADAVRAASETYSDDDGRLFAGEERAMFTASVDGKRSLGSGEVELAVDFTALHCFDPETGDALAVRRDAQPVA